MINRRTLLRYSLKMSALGLTALLPAPLAAMVKPGMRSIKGDVRINGQVAGLDAVVGPGDKVTTGEGGEATLISGFNAFLIRSDSEIVFPEDNATQKVLQVASGRILSVFGADKLTIDVPFATIGIRGTGVYVEAWPTRNYLCLCYGRAVLKSKLNPNVRESLSTRHHEAPRTLHADPGAHGGKYFAPAKMVNHTDVELIMLEALVGRIPLFGPEPIKMPDDTYGGTPKSGY